MFSKSSHILKRSTSLEKKSCCTTQVEKKLIKFFNVDLVNASIALMHSLLNMNIYFLSYLVINLGTVSLS